MPVIVCFEGNLATTPNRTLTPTTQTPVTTAVAMVNRRTKNNEGEWEDAAATRYDIKAWRRRADALAELTSGTRVVVIGHVETERWTDDQGKTHYRDTVIVDSLGAGIG